MRNAELRNKWITRTLKRQNKDKTEWKPSESDRINSIYFAGSAYEANSVATLNLGHKFKEWKARRISIRTNLPKKSEIKEKDVNDEDYVVPLPIFFTTESQSTVTCSTPYNWSVTPSASLDHSYCMNEENMSLPSYLDLSDEIKAFKIENIILKDKIKASK